MQQTVMGIDIFSAGFYVPVLIGLAALFILARVAKKLLKLGVFLAIIGLAVLIYFHIS